MKQWSKSVPALFVLFTGLLFAQRASAQCGLQLVGNASGCAPYNAEFERTDASGKAIKSVVWNYTGGTSQDTDAFYTINLKSPGTYKVSITVTYKDGSPPCTTTLPETITVFATPIAKINLPTDPVNGPIQCFKRNGLLNSFTFTESSTPGSSGAPIVQYYWNFGDGQTSTQHNPKHSYQAQGSYNISLRVVDSNGCEGYDTIVAKIKVLKDIQTGFKFTGVQGCNADSLNFTDITDTVGLGLKSWTWDFGDGTTNSSTFDPFHVFKPGTYNVKLTVENYLGCTATDSATIIATKFAIKVFFKDTVCWTDASKSGIVFNAEQQPSADLYTWNFGDPNSQQNDIINFEWTHVHKFVGGPLKGGSPASDFNAGGGPGIYLVDFREHDPNCLNVNNGYLDTCFYVHILGPEANITNLPGPPFPPNDTVPPVLVPPSDFMAINADRVTCDPQTIQYVVYRKLQNPPGATHWIYHFCNADTVVGPPGKPWFGKQEIYRDTMTDCQGSRKVPYVYGVTLKPTDSTKLVYQDSVPITYLWTRGDTLPTYRLAHHMAYYPPSGNLVLNEMNDTNLVTCSLPNLVRFTNNSIKYRLHYAIDDNTWQNVLDPSNSFRDTCKWKNYPMASDSLTYYWSFNDPSGDYTCTSTATNKDWNCNFSTLAAPYHYYKGYKGLPPTGCQNVQLTVYDPVTKCQDSTQMLLKQGPPIAGWNKAAYCKMTWEMQEFGTAPKGQPGPAGPPMIGFILNNQPITCAGPDYPFNIDFEQTIPTCGAEHYWLVFDSANTVQYTHCPGGDSVLNYGFTGASTVRGINAGYPSGGPDMEWTSPPWQGRYWWGVGDTGCKTIGVMLQVGKCFDVAWYHDYICFTKLTANFDIFTLTNPDTGRKSQANPYYGIGAGGGPTIPGDSGVGYTQVFVDSAVNSSTTFVLNSGHVCQPPSPNPFGATPKDIREGVTIYLFPRDTNQRDVNSFKYNITRERSYYDPYVFSNPSATWYYDYAPHGTNIGFWPDSAVLNPFTTASDSVAQVKEHISYIDTPYLYIIVPATAATAGLPVKRIIPNVPRKFAIYGTDTTGELDSLIARDSVAIPINDPRVRELPTKCGATHVEVYADPKFKVIGTDQILRLGGFKAVDSFKTDTIKADGPQTTLPYPGFYAINASATNLEGCKQSATYFLIYGHYATFWVNDSVICLGAPTQVHWYVRYWSHICVPDPTTGIAPDGCFNGAMEVPGLSPAIDFNPWDYQNPTAYRDTLTKGFVAPNRPWNQVPHPGYQAESVYLNFGDDTVFHFVPNTYKNAPAISPPHVYTKAGVYTITMLTIDWRGCHVYTRRQNLMKVIQVIAKFGLENKADTLTYCPPKNISFYDSSTIAGNIYKEKVVSNGAIVDSTYTVDSIQDRVWKPGDGQVVTRTGFEDSFTYDYIKADSLNVSLQILSSHTCSDSVQKKHLITIIGPEPRFSLIGNTAGCYPFTAHVKVSSHDLDASAHQWNFGDWPTLPTNPRSLPSDLDSQTLSSYPIIDSLTSLQYLADTGRFRVTLSETDTFRDVTGKVLPCFVTWPGPADSPQFFVRVYPNSPITITGDTIVCAGQAIPYIVRSKYNEYKKFKWKVIPSAHQDSDITHNGDSLNVILFTHKDWQAAKNSGDIDSNGNAVFTIIVDSAESDTPRVEPGITPSGCQAYGILKVHVQDSYAWFGIDSSQQNSGTFIFHDSSKYVKNYVLKYGDGDSINTLTPGWTVSHTYSNLGNTPTPEGLPQKPIGTFKVTLSTISSNGCKDDTSRWVTILREFDHYNVFTPNSEDTINARFSPFVKGQISSSLKIYNRWGQTVFQNKGSNSDTAWSRDPANTWDGNDQASGQPCPPGTYYYVWQFELVGGEKKTINGAVTLIR